jgi:hypothetical protein
MAGGVGMKQAIIRFGRAYYRINRDIFNGIKSAMDIPIVAGLTYGLITFLWLSVLLPGGLLR